MSDSVSPWTVAYQIPLSLNLFQKECCNGLPFPPPEDLPDSAIKQASPVALALAGGFFATEPRGKPFINTHI